MKVTDKHGQALEPYGYVRATVDGDGHKEGTGEKDNARNFPIETVLIQPEDLDRYCDEHLLSVSSLFRKLLKRKAL